MTKTGSSLKDFQQQEIDALHGFALDYKIKNRRITRTVTWENQVFETYRPHVGAAASSSQAWWMSFLRKAIPNENKGTEIRILDLFSSVGGMSLGFGEAVRAIGMVPKSFAAVDIDAGALRVYNRNHGPTVTLARSVSALVDNRVNGKGNHASFAYKPEIIGELAGLIGSENRPHVLLAGPPCQGHSTLNNHTRGDDPKNLLYLAVPAIAIALDIPIVIIENVPNVVNDRQGVVQTSRHLLESAGYHCEGFTLKADKLGWPQTRKRFFLVATKNEFPLSLSLLQGRLGHPDTPVEWVLDDLLDSVDNETLINSIPNMSLENQERIDYLVNSGERNLPNANRPDCHKDGTTYTAVYGRMFPNTPAPTITTGFSSPGRGRFIHPHRSRVLTPREAARIQGFPDWFQFVVDHKVTRTDLTTWIGNAVPSILAFTAGMSVIPELMRLQSPK